MPTYRKDEHLGHEVPLIETDDILKGAVTTDKLSDGAVATEKLADNSVTTPKIADEAVTTPKIADGAVTTPGIAKEAVTTDKIDDIAVTTEKIKDAAVTTPKLADGSVTTPKLADDAVVTSKIPDGAVTTEKLADSSVTEDKLADRAVTPDKIPDGSITGSKLQDNSIPIEKLEDKSIPTEKLKDQSITGDKFADGSITSDKIGEGEVKSQHIGDGEIQNHHIAEGAITNEKIAAGSIEALVGVVDEEPTPGNTEKLVSSDGLAQSLGHYIESPEFVRVYLDSEDRVLWGIQQDGNIYYGAGVPQQVREYISSQIDKIVGVDDATEKIDSLNEVVDFLEQFKNGDTLAAVLERMQEDTDSRIEDVSAKITNATADSTAAIDAEKERAEAAEQTLDESKANKAEVTEALDTKVDKENGKSLINKEYAEGIHYIESPEFTEVKLDSEDRILEATYTNGDKLFGAGAKVNKHLSVGDGADIAGDITTDDMSIKSVENPEFFSLLLDGNEKILNGIRKNGISYFPDLNVGKNLYVGGVLNNDFIQNQIDSVWSQTSATREKLRTLRKVSIIGDSISTFNQDGFKIDDFWMYYPEGNVQSVEDTWWKQVINGIGGIIEVNASFSSSRVTTSSVPNFADRVQLLGNPDVIYVALGTNDSANQVPVGVIDFNAESYDMTQFAPAYIKGMQDIVSMYPNSKVVCVAFVMDVVYQNAIETIAEHYGADYIYVGDLITGGIHPEKGEMTSVSNRILSVTGMEVENSEWLSVITDSRDKIIEGIKSSGAKEISVPVVFKGTVETDSKYEYVIDNPEYLRVETDISGKVINALRKDGSVVVGGVNFQDALNELAPHLTLGDFKPNMSKKAFIDLYNSKLDDYCVLCKCNINCMEKLNITDSQKEIYRKINHNFREREVVYTGMSSAVFASQLNKYFSIPVRRFADAKINKSGGVDASLIVGDMTSVYRQESEPSTLISDDGEKIELFCAVKGYIESSDGINWSVPQRLNLYDGVGSTVAFTYQKDHLHPSVHKIGGMYYMIRNITENDGETYMDLFTSENKTDWYYRGHLVRLGDEVSDGIFSSGELGNTYLFKDRDGTFYLLYESFTTNATWWDINLQTCTDIFSEQENGFIGDWVQCPENPILSSRRDGRPYCNPEIIKGQDNQPLRFNGRIYMIYLSYYTENGIRYTTLRRAYSEDVIHWVDEGPIFDNRDVPTGGPDYADNGDQSLCEFKGRTYLFYTHNINVKPGTADQHMTIRYTIDDRPLAELLKICM